jgi:gluconolactonase
MNARLEAFHALVPEGTEIELLADGAVEGPGLVYCEGPSWVNGKLYFSSMGYDASWNGDIPNSAFVEMDPDGAYRHLVYGKIETNGTFPLPGGTLAVCDMYGHRVIEMDTKGKVLRVLASTCDGKRLDGPNDLVADTKGGVYFSDPQILPEPHYQPGRSIIYIRPGGGTVRVVPPDVLIKPNGLILSPDNSILYVNSTHENFMMAYDVQADGTLANGRKFGKLRITPEVLDQESINTQVDGMTVDELGNVYITSMKGLQIFNPDGGYIGNVRFPLMPVNCCFGGAEGRDLYILCNDKVFRLRMNVRGAAYTMH